MRPHIPDGVTEFFEFQQYPMKKKRLPYKNSEDHIPLMKVIAYILTTNPRKLYSMDELISAIKEISGRKKVLEDSVGRLYDYLGKRAHGGFPIYTVDVDGRNKIFLRSIHPELGINCSEEQTNLYVDSSLGEDSKKRTGKSPVLPFATVSYAMSRSRKKDNTTIWVKASFIAAVREEKK